MTTNLLRIFFLILSFIIAREAFSETNSGGPCSGVSLLSLTDRGSISNTPCIMPSNQWLLETGYQYQRLAEGSGLQNYPQANLIYGLPGNTELMLMLPSYNQQSTPHISGFTSTSIGAKHEILYGKDWSIAGELFITPAGGSYAFGNQRTEILFNGIGSYNLNAKTSLTLMLGEGSNTNSRLDNGGRYSSFNPSLALAYAVNDKMNFFIEVFGQTKTNVNQGGNINADCGILYLVTKNLVLDLEVAQQISRPTNSFTQFIGAGASLKL